MNDNVIGLGSAIKLNLTIEPVGGYKLLLV